MSQKEERSSDEVAAAFFRQMKMFFEFEDLKEKVQQLEQDLHKVISMWRTERNIRRELERMER
jgi:heme-degrading monooxygenase HmoA